MTTKSGRRPVIVALGGAVVGSGGCLSRIRERNDPPSDDPDPPSGSNNASDETTDSDEDIEEAENDDGSNSPSDRLTYPAIDYGTQIVESDPAMWTASDGVSIVADEEIAVSGSHSLRVESESTDRATIGYAFPEPLNMEGRHLSMAVKVEAPSWGRIETRIRAPTNDHRLVCTRRLPPDMTDWFRVDFGITQGRAGGSPDLSNVQQIRIETRDTPGESTDIRYWIDDVRLTDGTGESSAILVFHGAYQSQYDYAFPLLEERGWVGAVAASAAPIGSDGRMSLDELRELRDAGWDICSLPWPRTSLQEMDAEEQREVIDGNRRFLEQHGFERGSRHFFAPRDRINGDTLQILRDVHDTGFIYGGGSSGIPPTGRYTIPTLIGSDYDGSRSAILRADIHDQLAVPLFGELGEDGMELDDFDAQLDRVESNDYGGGFAVITPSNLIDG